MVFCNEGLSQKMKAKLVIISVYTSACPNMSHLSWEGPQGTPQSRRSAANQRVPSRLPLERSAVSQDTSDVIMISADDAIGREV